MQPRGRLQTDLKTNLEASADKAIQGAVEHAPAKQGVLKGGNVQVKVTTGVVSLTGPVKTVADKRWAEHDAYEMAPGYIIADDLSLEATAISD